MIVVAAGNVTVGARSSAKTIYQFRGGARDGAAPQSGLIEDGNGNYFGTTAAGGGGTGCKEGNLGCGSIYELSANGKEIMLHASPEDATELCRSVVLSATRAEICMEPHPREVIATATPVTARYSKSLPTAQNRFFMHFRAQLTEHFRTAI